MNRATARTAGVLVLLAVALTAAAPARLRVHRGDTLSGIAGAHHTTVRALLDLNHLRGNATIYAGAIIRVPGRPVVHRVYVVRPGDNLTTVARRLHTTPGALRAGNSLRRSLLQIGQRLGYLSTGPAISTVSGSSHAGRRSAAGPVGRRNAAGPVGRRAAHDRAVLADRHVPSRSAVRSMIISAARRQHVEPALALAVGYQESGFQQRVVSSVDAVGVMQVLPSTASSLGRAHGRSFDVLTAADNIEAGVVLLRDLLQATGSWQGALAGYYQGLGSVHAHGLLPQTHDYIRSVGYLRHRFT